jgi:hypothetical protein
VFISPERYKICFVNCRLWNQKIVQVVLEDILQEKKKKKKRMTSTNSYVPHRIHVQPSVTSVGTQVDLPAALSSSSHCPSFVTEERVVSTPVRRTTVESFCFVLFYVLIIALVVIYVSSFYLCIKKCQLD